MRITNATKFCVNNNNSFVISASNQMPSITIKQLPNQKNSISYN